MSAQNLQRTGIYRIKAHKQPPSVLLLIAALALTGLGIALAFAVVAVRPFPTELDLMRALQSLIPDATVGTLLELERPLLISGAALALVVLGAMFLLSRGDAVFLVLSLPVTYAYFEVLKRWSARPRPTPDLVRVIQSSGTYAFPSSVVGLALVSAALCCYIAIRAYRAQPYAELRDKVAMVSVLLVSLLLIVLSTLAVLALGAHWPTDVLGSYLFGGAYTICAVLLRRQWMKWRGTDKVQ